MNETNPTHHVTHEQTASPTQGRPTGLIILMILIIAGTVGAGLWWQHQQTTTLHHQNQQHAHQMQALSARLDAEVKEHHERWQHSEDQLNELVNLANQSTEQNALLNAWQMLQLADYQRRYHHDAQAAATLIGLAAAQLNPQQYPTLRVVASTLKSNQRSMQRVAASRDPAQWLDQIDQVKGMLPQLQLIPAQLQAPVHTHGTQSNTSSMPPEQASTTDRSAKWQHMASHAWQEIKRVLAKMVVFERSNQSVTPLLTDNDRQMALNNLMFTLNQAQWAILNQEAKIYQQSIASASQQLAKHFTQHDAHNAQVMRQLNALAHIPIDVKLPTLNPSLLAVHNALSKTNPQKTSLKEEKKPILKPKESELKQENLAPSRTIKPAAARPFPKLRSQAHRSQTVHRHLPVA